MSTHKHIANISLALSAAGCAATYPLQGYFAGSLLFHGFLAATIGGMADWYGVTALFHKPLNIGFRTEVIPKNKDRIINELVSFLFGEVLTAEKITDIVCRQDFAKLLLAYLQEDDGLKKLHAALVPILNEAVANMDTSKLEGLAVTAIDEQVQKLQLGNRLVYALSCSIEKNYDAPLIGVLLDQADQLLQQSELKRIIEDLLSKAVAKYKDESWGRQLFISVSTKKYADQTIAMGRKYISDLHNVQHPQRQRLHQFLQQNIASAEMPRSIDSKLSLFVTNTASTKLHQYVQKLSQLDAATLYDLLSQLTMEFAGNNNWQAIFNEKARRYTALGVQELQPLMESTVRSKLEAYSAQEITELVETKVGDDLQMIRVNGAIVGGLVGMALFLLTTLVERMCG